MRNSSSRLNSVFVSATARSPRVTSRVPGSRRDVREGERVVTAGAPQQRAQPREELLERERLDEVVVGARVETGDPVAHGAARREHQDRHRVAVGADTACDLEPVDHGQHHVEHDGIGGGVHESGQPLRAVLCHDQLVALALEGPHQRVAHGGLVLDDQDSHRFG